DGHSARVGRLAEAGATRARCPALSRRAALLRSGGPLRCGRRPLRPRAARDRARARRVRGGVAVIDIRLVRAEPDRVKAELAKVAFPAAEVDALLEADRVRREALHAVEQLRAERTNASKAIRDLRDPAERERAIAAQRAVGDRIAEAEAAVARAEAEFERRMLEVPNLPHPDVPVGPDESANVVVRTVVEPRTLDFTPLPHWELGPRLGILDFERGVKISGSRFYV